jgi:hypothetical protein
LLVFEQDRLIRPALQHISKVLTITALFVFSAHDCGIPFTGWKDADDPPNRNAACKEKMIRQEWCSDQDSASAGYRIPAGFWA